MYVPFSESRGKLKRVSIAAAHLPWTAAFLCFAYPSFSSAQTTTAPAAPPEPLPFPLIVGPLKGALPHTFDAGPFGTLHLNGIISGMGLWEGSPIGDDDPLHADL